MSKTGLTLQLSGQDGNAMFIIGRARAVMRDAKVSDELISEFTGLATDGTYDDLIRLCMEWLEVR